MTNAKMQRHRRRRYDEHGRRVIRCRDGGATTRLRHSSSRQGHRGIYVIYNIHEIEDARYSISIYITRRGRRHLSKNIADCRWLASHRPARPSMPACSFDASSADTSSKCRDAVITAIRYHAHAHKKKNHLPSATEERGRRYRSCLPTFIFTYILVRPTMYNKCTMYARCTWQHAARRSICQPHVVSFLPTYFIFFPFPALAKTAWRATASRQAAYYRADIQHVR